MNEDYLQYLWRYQRFERPRLTCASGRDLTVLFPGIWNKQAGPDFLEAKVRIGRKLWLGSVEVHIKSSDWRKHNHHEDRAYDNVILHVVLEDDEPLVNANGQEVPTLILKDLIDESHFAHYRSFIEDFSALPCAKGIQMVEEAHRASWLHRMAVERLEQKVKTVEKLMHRYGNDLNAVWWHMLCRSFGFGLNHNAYEIFAGSLSWKQVAWLSGRPFDLESLLAVHSGWFDLDKRLADIPGFRQRYEHHHRLWSLEPVPPSAWHRGRVKPANHPRVRLGQLHALVMNGFVQWRSVCDETSLDSLMESFEKRSNVIGLNLKAIKGLSEKMGFRSIELLCANAVIPMRFYAAIWHNNQAEKDRMIQWMEKIDAENNRVTRMWSKVGWKPKSMLDSQGQIHLFKNYCSQKKCLSCLIGIQLLNHHYHDPTDT